MPKTTLWIDKEFNQCKIYVFSVFGILKEVSGARPPFLGLQLVAKDFRIQNYHPGRTLLAIELVFELGIASAEGGNILKHQNYSDCHHHDLKVAQTH